jgi:hypothetical protein
MIEVHAHASQDEIEKEGKVLAWYFIACLKIVIACFCGSPFERKITRIA